MSLESRADRLGPVDDIVAVIREPGWTPASDGPGELAPDAGEVWLNDRPVNPSQYLSGARG